MKTDHDHDHDAAQLAELGYHQRLHRVLGLFQNFSVGFTYLSPVVGVYALYALLLPSGGAASLFWSIPLVVAGQTLVALTFGEVGSQYPIAGGIYQWARRLVSREYGWIAAWIYMCALLATIASVATLSDGFFAALFDYTPTKNTKFFIALALIVTAGVLNQLGPKVLGRVAQVGFWCEIVGSVGLGLFLILFNNKGGLGNVLDTTHMVGDAPVGGGLTAAIFLGSLLFSMWIFYGFEACGDVAEEVKNASRQIPRAMLMTMGVAAVSSLIITVGFIVGIDDFGALFTSGEDPINAVVSDAFNGNELLIRITFLLICIAFVSCAMAIQAATARLLFSFGRDRQIFGAKALATVHPVRRVPTVATAAATVIPAAIAALDVYWASGRIVYFAIAGIYTAFQLVVLGAIIAKLRGWKPSGAFTLGGLGLVVNIAALAYGVFGIWVLCTKGGSFDPAGSFVDRNLVAVSLVGVTLVGMAYLLAMRPTRHHPLPEHSTRTEHSTVG
jgi:amino acid transporter